MPDKDITIGITTKGDTSGAEAVEKSIFSVESAAKRAEREMDVMEAKRRKQARESEGQGGFFGMDVSEGAANAVQGAAEAAGFGKQAAKLRSMMAADSVAIAGSFAVIGAAAVEAYQMMGGAVERYQQMAAAAKAEGQDLGPELAEQVRLLEEQLGPVKSIIDGVSSTLSGVWKVAKDPAGEFSGLNDLEEALQRSKEQAEALKKARLSVATDNSSALLERYRAETEELRQQEALLQRIQGLREERSGIEQSRARQEVQFARQYGGDVPLAEANVLSRELASDMQKLRDDLSETQRSAEAAREAQANAQVVYSQAIQDGLDKLDPERFAALSKAVDDTAKAVSDSETLLSEVSQNIEARRRMEIDDLMLRFNELEDQYAGEMSSAAKAAFDGVYAKLQEEVSKTSTNGLAMVETFRTYSTEQRTQQSEVTASIGELLGVVREQSAVLKVQQGEIAALKTQIQSMR